MKVDNTIIFPRTPTLADGEALLNNETLVDSKDLPDSDALLVPGSQGLEKATAGFHFE